MNNNDKQNQHGIFKSFRKEARVRNFVRCTSNLYRNLNSRNQFEKPWMISSIKILLTVCPEKNIHLGCSGFFFVEEKRNLFNLFGKKKFLLETCQVNIKVVDDSIIPRIDLFQKSFIRSLVGVVDLFLFCRFRSQFTNSLASQL